jgi:hypothetical protein
MSRSHLLALLICVVLLLSSVSGITPSYAQGDETAHDAIIAQIPTLANFAAQAQQTFVGEVEGSYAYIAFVVQGNLAVVYVCDSIGVSGWFKAELVEGVIRVADEQRGIQIVATLSGEQIKGVVSLATDDDGSAIVAHDFVAAPAVPGKTGLARYADEDVVSGWIVTEQGIRGIKKALSCRAYRREVETLRQLLNNTSDAATRSALADQIINTNLDAIIAGCENVAT